MRRLVATAGVVLSLALPIASAPAPAFAQQSDAAIATELFNAGRDLMRDGNFAAACPKLTESARLDPKVGTFAKLGECEEKLGRLASARGRWQQALNLAQTAGDERVKLVEAELARIDRIVPKLSIATSGAAPAGLAVRVDDVEVGAGSLGVPLPVDPGKHTVTATATGRKPWSTVVVTNADGAVIRVAIPELEQQAAPTAMPPQLPPPVTAATPVPVAAPPPSDEKPHASSTPLRAIGLVTAGAGVVALGVGTAFGVVAKQRFDQSNQQGCSGPNGNDCPGASFDTRNQARTAGNLSTAFFVAGGVLVAGGVTMWLLAPRGDATPSVMLRATPAVGPGFAGVGLQGTWR